VVEETNRGERRETDLQIRDRRREHNQGDEALERD
jgi:hypothetical protein